MSRNNKLKKIRRTKKIKNLKKVNIKYKRAILNRKKNHSIKSIR